MFSGNTEIGEAKAMTKRKIMCHHCSKKFTVITNGDLKKVKGASWWPLMRKVDSVEWIEDWKLGIGLRCKCGKAFFAYGIQNEESDIQVEPSLREDLLLAWFCNSCRSSFIDQQMICPTCNTQY